MDIASDRLDTWFAWPFGRVTVCLCQAGGGTCMLFSCNQRLVISQVLCCGFNFFSWFRSCLTLFMFIPVYLQSHDLNGNSYGKTVFYHPDGDGRPEKTRSHWLGVSIFMEDPIWSLVWFRGTPTSETSGLSKVIVSAQRWCPDSDWISEDKMRDGHGTSPALALTPIWMLLVKLNHSGKNLKQTKSQHFWPVKPSKIIQNPQLHQAFRAFVDPELRKWVERTWPGWWGFVQRVTLRDPTDPTVYHHVK